MSDFSTSPTPTDGEILSARSEKNRVDPHRPYAFQIEPERTAAGRVEDVATIFLTNRECPFRCLMCDLWENTLDVSVAAGDIPRQIDYALSKLPSARHIKLYNSGNFFDRRAIPPSDHVRIAGQVSSFETVIIENHPRFCTEQCLHFRDMIGTNLEVAIGLETIHPDVLPRLNKQMTCDDFERATQFLTENDIAVRAFILLRPPFLNEAQGVEWACKSVEFAFSVGVGCCVVIPTRTGNGILEQLQDRAEFSPPTITSMETVLETTLAINGGRVFVDLWDVERFITCNNCGPARAERLKQMNFTQEILPPVVCECGGRA